MQQRKNIFKVRGLSILLFVLAMFILLISHKQFIVATAKKQLQNTFPGSSVSIAGATLELTRALELNDVEIKKEKAYAVKVKKIRVEYTFVSLFKKNITRVTLSDITSNIDTPHKNILEFTKHINPAGKPFFKVQTIEAVNARINIQAQDIRMRAVVSLTFDALRQVMHRLTVSLDSLALGEINIQKAHCTVNQDSPAGEFLVKEIGYKKAKIQDISGSARLSGDTFSLTQLNARLFNGTLKGDIVLSLRTAPVYTFALRFFDLDVAMIPEDFELKDKFTITGTWRGNLYCNGKGAKIGSFDGNFAALSPGGNLTITDRKFLKDIAQRTSIPEDILVERFKDYYYNKGAMDASLANGALILGIVLEGDKGRSNFKINLHDALQGISGIIKRGGGGA
ncbi:MAG: hypothetical protein PHV55_00365 [Candidatus Omnitrophica bacterium]|nr:hypothetical protein [Candidatus Omnitrophota bacterium]